MPKINLSTETETTAPDSKLLWLETEISDTYRLADEHFATGHPGAGEEGEALQLVALRAMERMFATHATTNAGRAAKARVWLRHGASEAWRRDLENGDMEQTQLVEVLADLCGMSPLSLAHGYTDAHVAERN
jgi:hypothetical protein